MISIEDPFYTCPDGKVLKCKVIALQWYCGCVREKGVGPTDQAMSATTSSPRKAGEQMLSRRNSGDKGASVNETYATIVIARKKILNWNILTNYCATWIN